MAMNAQHIQTKPGKHTIVALVENKPGVLNRVASLIRRRAFNVDSLTVGRTHKPHVSRMTIVIDSESVNGALIAANLRKLVNVIDVRLLTDEPHVSRDLVLVKLRSEGAEASNRITTVCERFPARIIDIGPDVAIVEMTGSQELVEEFIEEVRPIGIVEMIRTGLVAMGRGTRIYDTSYEPSKKAATVNGNDGNGYII